MPRHTAPDHNPVTPANPTPTMTPSAPIRSSRIPQPSELPGTPTRASRRDHTLSRPPQEFLEENFPGEAGPSRAGAENNSTYNITMGSSSPFDENPPSPTPVRSGTMHANGAPTSAQHDNNPPSSPSTVRLIDDEQASQYQHEYSSQRTSHGALTPDPELIIEQNLDFVIYEDPEPDQRAAMLDAQHVPRVMERDNEKENSAFLAEWVQMTEAQRAEHSEATRQHMEELMREGVDDDE
ncbi:uncharacterized protein K452DRAFT_361646 [Aplosporella prunicola CBS 121167]|uniref:Uncharacterized protein n=1 Tax=Aplosporella prunicola CBS 121167 TaxID=1176127 RepID=A0A6A6B239_9PEZI|nr:uncharacterized protein K452DRAFT_361646 [Aplosporella prunicola CBS 121167]KAF2137876.1 hypothetical protein K452DRAFT_361646 [Aplosporella prunicola CBS 121167]